MRWCVLLLSFLPAPVRAQEAVNAGAAVDTSAAVQVETRLSQSAVWPGDRIEYSVRLILSPSIRLADQDLTGTALPWAPFRLLDSGRRDDRRNDGAHVVTLTYHLVAVDLPDGGSAQIPTLRVSYYREPDAPSARRDVPMEEESVPGPRVAFRSTLVGDVENATIRDGKDLEDGPLPGRTLLLIGIGGLLVGAYPLGRSAYPVLRRLVSRPQVLEARTQKRHLREELAELRGMALVEPEDYERLFGLVLDVLREHLTLRYEVSYPGLTSLDVDALGREGVPDEALRRIDALVRECEEIRYRGGLPEGAEERARRAVGALDEIVSTG